MEWGWCRCFEYISVQKNHCTYAHKEVTHVECETRMWAKMIMTIYPENSLECFEFTAHNWRFSRHTCLFLRPSILPRNLRMKKWFEKSSQSVFWNPIAHLNSQKLLTEQPDASRITHFTSLQGLLPFCHIHHRFHQHTNQYVQSTNCMQQCPKKKTFYNNAHF